MSQNGRVNAHEDSEDDEDARFDEILAIYFDTVDRGERVDREAFIREHIEFEDGLREFFADADGVACVCGSSESWSAAPPLSDNEPAPPDVIGDYELLEEIGRGGMGIVFRARQSSLKRVVAVKTILRADVASGNSRARFMREAHQAAKLRHPNIVAVHEVWEHDGRPYFSMDYIEGRDLRAAVLDSPLPCKEAAGYVLKVARAISYAHQQETIHRDLKPSNILIDTNDEPLVTDFGLAKDASGDSDITREGAGCGAPSYMSPEQAMPRGRTVGPPTDVYSLGATLYDLVTGRPPFQAASPELTVLQLLSVEPALPRTLNPDVDLDLETICLKCLKKEPERRYESAAALADDLERYLDGRPISARPIGSLARLCRWFKRSPVIGSLVLVVLASLVAVAGMGVATHIRTSQSLAAVKKSEATAVRAKDEAENAAESERSAKVAERKHRRVAESLLIDMFTSRGLAESESGHYQEAGVWFAGVPSLSTDYPNRQYASRLRLSLWLRTTPTPVCAFRHSGARIVEIEFHPKAKHLMVRSGEPRCEVWEIEAEPEKIPLIASRDITSCAWNAAGDRLAVGTSEGVVYVLGFPDMKRLFEVRGGETVHTLCFSPDGRNLAIGSSCARVWDLDAKAFRAAEFSHPGPVKQLAFDSNGDYLATACADGNARVFRLSAGAAAQPLHGLSPNIGAAINRSTFRRPVFLAERLVLLTVADDRHIGWLDLQTGERREILAGLSPIGGIVPSPDGRLVVAHGFAASYFLDDANGRPVGARMPHADGVSGAAFSPDGQVLLTAAGDRTGRFWSVPSGKPLSDPIPFADNPNKVAFSHDGSLFATTHAGGEVCIWHRPGEAWDVRIMSEPGGDLAACGDGRHVFLNNRVYDLSTGEPAGPEVAGSGSLISSEFTPDGQKLVTVFASWDDARAGVVTYWDWRRGSAIAEPTRTPSRPVDVCVNPEDACAAVVCEGGEILIVDPKSGKVQRELSFRPGARGDLRTARVQFSADGKYLAMIVADSAVSVWETLTGRECYTIDNHVTGARFSGDGRFLVTSSIDGTSCIYWAASGTPAAAPLVHPDWVFSAEFTPDGKYVITTCRDKMARLWDWQDTPNTTMAFEHANVVRDARVSPDGRWIVTRCNNGTGQVWDLGTGQAIMPSRLMSELQATPLFSPDGRYLILQKKAYAAAIDFHKLATSDLYELEPERIQTLGEIVSSRRLQGGLPVNLNLDEWHARWREYGQDHTLRSALSALASRPAEPANSKPLVPRSLAAQTAALPTEPEPPARSHGGQVSLPKQHTPTLLEQLGIPPYVPEGRFAYVDLQAKANRKLADGEYMPDNDLGTLPSGVLPLGGVPFEIGESCIQLGCNRIPSWPGRIDGIVVKRRVKTLFMLHATSGGTVHGAKERQMVGTWTVHYADETTKEAPIIYGVDTRDWWGAGDSDGPLRARAVWQGVNPASRKSGKSIWLYLSSWENPHPEKTIVAIDFASVQTQPAAPFCVALTVQEASGPPAQN